MTCPGSACVNNRGHLIGRLCWLNERVLWMCVIGQVQRWTLTEETVAPIAAARCLATWEKKLSGLTIEKWLWILTHGLFQTLRQPSMYLHSSTPEVLGCSPGCLLSLRVRSMACPGIRKPQSCWFYLSKQWFPLWTHLNSFETLEKAHIKYILIFVTAVSKKQECLVTK